MFSILKHSFRPMVKPLFSANRTISYLSVDRVQNPSLKNKLFSSTKEALYDFKSGSSVVVGGFGIAGIPENCFREVEKLDVNDIHIISNTAGLEDFCHGPLMPKMKRLSASYVGENPVFDQAYLTGEIECEFIPQGTLAERIRCGAAGIPAFFTPTGVGTSVEEGYPLKFSKDGSYPHKSDKKERRVFDGREYIMEPAFFADYAFVKAYQADRKGNLRFRKTARNFNPDMAGAAKITIAEVEEIVDELPPEKVHWPGCFVDRVVKGEHFCKKIERIKIKPKEAPKAEKGQEPVPKKALSKREIIIKRAVKEFTNGMYSNLGIGIPTLAAANVGDSIEVHLQGENGIVGIGPYPTEDKLDCDLINAGKESVTELNYTSYVKSSESFGMMRGKHLHMTMLGGLEVSQTADLANWIIPGKKCTGMGGAMDLVSSRSKVVVVMEHCAKDGSSKVKKQCSIPLTGKGVVSKLITDLAVFEFDDDGMILKEIAPGLSVDDLKKSTEAEFRIDPELKSMS